MRREMILRVMAGTNVIISTLLGYYHSEYWFLFTLFIGANLIQSAFTGICPATTIMRKWNIGNE